MSEDRKGFIVNDRRHFTPEGFARTETEVPGAEPALAPHEPGEAKGPRAEDAAEVDFASLLVSLAAQAKALLGLGIPQGEESKPDLAGARSLIAILEMLQRKTEGRRSAEEDELLDGILYDLRMAYVARTRGRA